MYDRILVPIDGSGASDLGVGEAIKLAKLSGGSICLLHVVNEYLAIQGAYYSAELTKALHVQGEALLASARERVQKAGIKVDTAMLDGIKGASSDLIVDYAKSWPAQLIVMGTHGRRGLSRLALGSDAENVVRMAPVPVLLVREVAVAAQRAAA
jgi:nucleotide-binding universal stress UspA family protein